MSQGWIDAARGILVMALAAIFRAEWLEFDNRRTIDVEYTIKYQKARLRGHRAASLGLCEKVNPYSLGDVRRRAWFDGYYSLRIEIAERMARERLGLTTEYRA